MDSKFYILIFDHMGRSVSPLYPVKREAVESKLSCPPYGRLQIDPAGFAAATSYAETEPLEEPFLIKTPLATDLFKFYKSLGMVTLELPSVEAFKFLVQGKYPYIDNLFFRIKFSNPERHLQTISEHLIKQGYQVQMDKNLGEDTVVVSLPAFFGYDHLIRETDRVAEWLKTNKLTVSKVRLDLITFVDPDAKTQFYYIGPGELDEKETFLSSDEAYPNLEEE
jgi:hypothetical protein